MKNIAHYPDVTPERIRLLPPKFRWKDLEADYLSMREMLFGKIPAFDEILSGIRILENEIHSL